MARRIEIQQTSHTTAHSFCLTGMRYIFKVTCKEPVSSKVCKYSHFVFHREKNK